MTCLVQKAVRLFCLSSTNRRTDWATTWASTKEVSQQRSTEKSTLKVTSDLGTSENCSQASWRIGMQETMPRSLSMTSRSERISRRRCSATSTPSTRTKEKKGNGASERSNSSPRWTKMMTISLIRSKMRVGLRSLSRQADGKCKLVDR